MNKKITVYLHIGQPKTGTSAIQGFLNYNREILAAKYGILYPNFNSRELNKGHQHNHAQFFLNAKLNNDFNGCFKKIKKCIEYCESNQIDKIILSNEGFFWHWWPGFMEKIFKKLNVDFKIILYLRRQDKWVESAWKQWGHKSPKYKDIYDYIKNTSLDWYKSLNIWLKYFELSKFIIRSYEKETIGNDIIVDFMSLIGLKDISKLSSAPRTNEVLNTGFSKDVIELLNYSKTLIKDNNDNHLIKFMFENLPQQFIKKPLQEYDILTPSDRLEIINKYEESNKKLAKLICGSESERFFNSPLPEVTQEKKSNEGLTIEKLVPIVMALFLKQNNKILALNRKVNVLTKQLIDSNKNFKMIKNVDMESVFDKMSFNEQIINKKVEERKLVIHSKHNDPFIILPEISLSKEVKHLKIDITVPIDTISQLFFKLDLKDRYSEINSEKKEVLKGRNIVYFPIPAEKIKGRLRFDPGTSPGKYIIHSIEFTS